MLIEDGCAPITYPLFHKLMKHPAHSECADRDLFVLSNGHASMLLYGTLFVLGYKVTLDDLKSFRTSGSKTLGHPEYGWTGGVEVTTGSAGAKFRHGARRLLFRRRWMSPPSWRLIPKHRSIPLSNGLVVTLLA